MSLTLAYSGPFRKLGGSLLRQSVGLSLADADVGTKREQDAVNFGKARESATIPALFCFDPDALGVRIFAQFLKRITSKRSLI